MAQTDSCGENPVNARSERIGYRFPLAVLLTIRSPPHGMHPEISADAHKQKQKEEQYLAQIRHIILRRRTSPIAERTSACWAALT